MEHAFTTAIQELFEPERIVCLLFYGSNAFGRAERVESDYDFYLMLDTYHEEDHARLREVLTRFDGHIDLSFRYLADIEARGWDNYQHGNHGVFFAYHFAQARTLLGFNIFQRKIIRFGRDDFVRSMLSQIEEYFWRMDTYAIKERDERKLLEFLRKYLIRAAYDILIIKEDISFSEVNTLKNLEIAQQTLAKPYFSAHTRDCFRRIAAPDEQDVATSIELKRSLYEDYLQLQQAYNAGTL